MKTSEEKISCLQKESVLKPVLTSSVMQYKKWERRGGEEEQQQQQDVGVWMYGKMVR